MNFSSGVDCLVRHFGSVNNVAKAVNCTRSAVWKWRTKGVPVKVAIKLNEESHGKIMLGDLRPDIWKR